MMGLVEEGQEIIKRARRRKTPQQTSH